MVCSSVPSLVVVVGSYYYMEESARFLLATGQYEKSFAVLDKFIVLNKSG